MLIQNLVDAAKTKYNISKEQKNIVLGITVEDVYNKAKELLN